jgi:hypothetical protein
MNATATPAERIRAGRLFGKFSNQSVKIVTGVSDRSSRRVARDGG